MQSLRIFLKEFWASLRELFMDVTDTVTDTVTEQAEDTSDTTDATDTIKASQADAPCEGCGNARDEDGRDEDSRDKDSRADVTQLLQFRGRRRFLHRLSVALGGVMSALVAIPFIGFIFVSRRAGPETAWRVVGAIDDFPIGETIRVSFVDPDPLPWAGFSAQTAAWVRRSEEGHFTALSVYCTHVGCPIRWLEGSRLFMCPCHGGSFFEDGSVAGGPPRRALDRYEIRVREGQVEILAGAQPLPI